MLEFAVQTKEGSVDLRFRNRTYRTGLAIHIMCPADMITLSVDLFLSGV